MPPPPKPTSNSSSSRARGRPWRRAATAVALALALAACGNDAPPARSAHHLNRSAQPIVRRLPAAGPPTLLEFAPEAMPLDAFVRDVGQWYAMRGNDELRSIGEVRGPGGVTYARLQQYYQGLPIVGNQVTIAAVDGFVRTTTGRFSPDIALATTPARSSTDAVAAVTDLATRKLRERGLTARAGAETVSLVIIADGATRWRLAYAVELPYPDVQTFWAFVDATTGEVLHLDDGRREATGTVDHAYEGPQVPISVSPDPSGFLLKSEDGLVYTRNANNNNAPPAMSTDVTSPTLMFAPSWSADAHYGAGVTMDFLAKRFARNGWDGVGTQLPVFANVMWNNSGFIKPQNHLEIGNTSGGASKNWATLDLIGHEVGHGVTYASVVPMGSPPGTTGGLVYQGESGALDESFADILGTLVEDYGRQGKPVGGNWTLFEDAFPPGGLRDMKTPAAGNQPDSYGDPALWQSTVMGAADFGGVHTNSGVGNKWFYLLADDSVALGVPSANAFATSYHVRPIGKEAAGLVAYVGLFNMASGSTYADARTATLAATTQLCAQPGPNGPLPLVDTQAYGSVWESWRAVAVGAAADLAPTGWVEPVGNQTGVNPADATLQFTADWDPADTYAIELDTSPSFAAPTLLSAGPGDTYWDANAGLTRVKVKVAPGTLDANKQYWWRVRNDDVAALAPELAAACTRPAQSFTTGQWQVVLKAPMGPDQHPWNLQFDWETFAGIAKFEFELYSTNDINQPPDWTDTVIAPPYELDVQMFHDYYWRVRAISMAGEAGPWTALAQFSTLTPLGELAGPVDNSELYPWGIPLSWKPVKGAETYRLELTDYPECFPPGVQVESTFVDVPGEKTERVTSFQPTWDGQHRHCWRMTPVGPELFKGKYKAEDGAVSDPWKIITKDHDTLPGSMAPLDRVVDPAFWNDRAPYLLFPSVLSVADVPFAWKGVPQAESYRVEYFPILGGKYSPDDLYLLVGALPHVPASPTIQGQEPPTAITMSTMTMATMYFNSKPPLLYGFWYRIVALGPDGTHSPSPPWQGVIDQAMFANDDAFNVPHEYALLSAQQATTSSGVVLLRPPPIKLIDSGNSGQVWGSPAGNWPGWFATAAPAIDGVPLWAPWSAYNAGVSPGPGCDPATASWNWPDSSDWLPTKLSYSSSAPMLSMSVRIVENYGQDGFGDPGTYWKNSPFAGTPEAAPFATGTECVDLVLPEPDNYGGSDGAPDDPPPADPVAACDAQVQQGGNAAETHVVELGKSSGTTVFAVNTYDVPDALTVSYEGTALAKTGCFGTGTLPDACNAGGWCCDTGVCWAEIYYSGSSTQMTVSVDPNCAGPGDTEWAFQLTCPQ